MEWIHDVRGSQYKQLLTTLLTHCDMVQCIIREDVEDYFEDIAQELIAKNYVTSWPLTNQGHEAVPVLQYTFRFGYNTAEFLKHKQSSLFSWQMPHPEDLSFWKEERCLLATCSHEQYIDIDGTLRKKVEPLFVRK